MSADGHLSAQPDRVAAAGRTEPGGPAPGRGDPNTTLATRLRVPYGNLADVDAFAGMIANARSR